MLKSLINTYHGKKMQREKGRGHFIKSTLTGYAVKKYHPTVKCAGSQCKNSPFVHNVKLSVLQTSVKRSHAQTLNLICNEFVAIFNNHRKIKSMQQYIHVINHARGAYLIIIIPSFVILSFSYFLWFISILTDMHTTMIGDDFVRVNLSE